MASALETRRRRQLGGAVLQYLQSEYPQAAEVYRNEASKGGNPLNLPTESDQLYKKWSATMRLQLKVDALEKTVAELKDKLLLFESASKFKSTNDSLPRSPPIETLTGHRQAIQRLAFHPLFLLLASCSDDGLILIWEYENGGTLVRTLRGHTACVHDIDFDSTGKLLASCSSDTSVKIWDCSNFECLRTLNGHDLLVSCVRFLPGGERLLSCSKDKSIRLWETHNGYCIKTFHGHSDWVRTLAIAPQGIYFASAGSDQMILFWATDSAENAPPISQYTGHSHVIESLVFANIPMLEVLLKEGKAPPPINSEELFGPRKDSSGTRNTATAIDQLFHSTMGIPNENQGGFIQSSSPVNGDHTSAHILNQTGPVLFSASRDKSIKMWDPMQKKCLQTFDGHLNWVKEVTVHPGGLTIASCSDDKSIRVWDVLTGRCVASIDPAHRLFVTCCRFSTKSSVLVSGSMDKEIRLWECTRTNSSNEAPHDDDSNTTVVNNNHHHHYPPPQLTT